MVRVQPVAGSMGDNHFCLFGGFAPAANGEEAKLAMELVLYMTRRLMSGSWLKVRKTTKESLCL